MYNKVNQVINKLESLLWMEDTTDIDRQWRELVMFHWDHALTIKNEILVRSMGGDAPFACHDTELNILEEFAEYMLKTKELANTLNLIQVQLEKMEGVDVHTESEVRDLKGMCQAACRLLH